MTQFQACFKKELLLFSRTRRLLALVLIILGVAVLDSAQIYLLSQLGTVYDGLMEEMSESAGADLSGGVNMSGVLTEVYGENPRQALAVALFAADMASTGLIATTLLLMNAAGGEQKKRATIIPACAGLKPENYLLPKFLLYPSAVFALTVIGTFVAYGVSTQLYVPDDLTFARVMLCGVLNGFFLAFLMCLHLFIGLSTSRPGFSALGIIIATSLLLPVLSMPGSGEKYNPFALHILSSRALTADVGSGAIPALNLANISASFIVSIALVLLMYFLTLFVLKAKKVDNSGNDIIV